MRKNHQTKMNPKGFLEIPGVVTQGLSSVGKFGGKAVKIITSGIWPRVLGDGRVIGTPTSVVDKYILCLRDPKHISISQQDLAGVAFTGDEDGNWEFVKQIVSPKRYISRTGLFLVWLSKQGPEVANKFLIVDYSDMVDRTEDCIEEIIQHLDISPSEEQIESAIANVSIDLKRSDILDEWPEGLEADGDIADNIYNSLLKLDTAYLQATAAEVQELIEEDKLENVRWVDDESTWVSVIPSLKRDIISNTNGVADALKISLAKKRSQRLICDQCKYYSRDDEKTYAIERPIDLGPLTRPMVKCKRDDNYKTVEECKFCWQKGSIKDGESKAPQRLVKD